MEKIKNKKIMKVASGGSNGSIVVFTIGGFEVSYLFVYSTWRIEKMSFVIATSNDDPSSPDGNLWKQTQLLKNDIIIDVEISNNYDIVMEFESGKFFRVFRDIHPNSKMEESWSICSKLENTCFSPSIDNSVKKYSYE